MSRGGVYKRGGVWWLRYSAGGRQVRETADTSRKEQAEALLRERLQAVWEGRHFPGKRRAKAQHMTVAKLRDDWLAERASKKSIGMDKTRLRRAVEHFGAGRLVVTITAEDVSAWRAELAKDKLSVATINRHLASLRGAINLAVDRGHLASSPMRGVRLEKESNERDRLCSRAEYERLRDAAEGDLRAIIVMGYWLGMRLGEISGLAWNRVDLERGTLRLRASATKEGAAKPLPLPTEAVKELKALPRNISGRVFRHTVQTYSRKFAELCGELKIEELRFHDLRHTAVTRMLEAGVDLRTIQAFTGHKTLLMVKRYAKVTETRMRDAMSAIEAHETRGLDASKR